MRKNPTKEFTASQRLGLAAVRNNKTHETISLEKQQMKTSKWVLAACIIVALAGIAVGVSGCKEKESSQGQTPGGATTVQYTCNMHPEVVQDKPGKCPKCGMELTVKK
jgi:hypothetical protein